MQSVLQVHRVYKVNRDLKEIQVNKDLKVYKDLKEMHLLMMTLLLNN